MLAASGVSLTWGHAWPQLAAAGSSSSDRTRLLWPSLRTSQHDHMLCTQAEAGVAFGRNGVHPRAPRVTLQETRVEGIRTYIYICMCVYMHNIYTYIYIQELPV